MGRYIRGIKRVIEGTVCFKITKKTTSILKKKKRFSSSIDMKNFNCILSCAKEAGRS